MDLASLAERLELSEEERRRLRDAARELERLRGREALLDSVLDSLSEGVVAADRDGNFELFNAEAQRLLGLGAVPGGPSTWAETYGVFLPDGATPFPADRFPLTLAARGESTDGVEQFVRNASFPEGKYLSVSGRPWRSRSGELLGGAVTFEDVTELRKAREALRRLNADLERRVEERSRELQLTQEQLWQAQRLEALGQFCGSVAHDFNNLLTAINGYAEWALGDKAADPREALQEIHRSGERAAELTRQLLAFSRRQPIQPRAVSLNVVVDSVTKLLRRLVGPGIELHVELDRELPPVMADVGHVEQILLNLAVNARDAMPDGGHLTLETHGVRLTEHHAHRRLAAPPGSYAQLCVTDTGCGMDAATQARVFEPFFTTKEPGRGTGLGLSTVFGIVRQHRGDVWLYSEPGQGTTFKIFLPVATTAEAQASREALAPARGGDETILVAEDEPAVLALVRATLRSFGYTVLEAPDGASALRIGESHPGPIHLLLTDSVMPGTSGSVLARRLSASRTDLRVLYMSGYPERAIAVNGHVNPEENFLAKPFSPLGLARKVRDVLDR